MQLDAGWGTVEAIAEGAGDGLAVLLHAAGSSPRALGALAKTMRETAGRSIAPVLPMTIEPASAGGTSHPLSRQIAVAKAALAHGATGRRVLFGHSFGGLVALLALLDGARPDVVVLYEPIVLAALDPADPEDEHARAWDRALIDHLAERQAAGDPEPGVARFIEAYNEVAWTRLPDTARAAILADAAGTRCPDAGRAPSPARSRSPEPAHRARAGAQRRALAKAGAAHDETGGQAAAEWPPQSGR